MPPTTTTRSPRPRRLTGNAPVQRFVAKPSTPPAIAKARAVERAQAQGKQAANGSPAGCAACAGRHRPHTCGKADGGGPKQERAKRPGRAQSLPALRSPHLLRRPHARRGGDDGEASSTGHHHRHGVWTVERLLQRRRAQGDGGSVTWEYLVRWAGYDSNDDTWQDEDDFSDRRIIEECARLPSEVETRGFYLDHRSPPLADRLHARISLWQVPPRGDARGVVRGGGGGGGGYGGCGGRGDARRLALPTTALILGSRPALALTPPQPPARSRAARQGVEQGGGRVGCRVVGLGGGRRASGGSGGGGNCGGSAEFRRRRRDGRRRPRRSRGRRRLWTR
jgi:hypothetical protein